MAKERRAVRLTVGAFQEQARAIHRDLAKERSAAEKDAIAAKELKARLKGVKKVWGAEPKEDPDPMETAISPRCTAHSRSGERCRKPPIHGGNVCRNHGGAAPLVIKSARERLLAAVDPAIASLTNIVKLGASSKDFEKLLERNPRLLSAVVSATTAILDRSGYPATKEFVIGTPQQARENLAELLGVSPEILAAMEAEETAPALPSWPQLPPAPAELSAPDAPLPEDGTAPNWSTYLASAPEREASATLAGLTVRADAENALAAELAGAKRGSVMAAAIGSPAWSATATTATTAMPSESLAEEIIGDPITADAIEAGEPGAEDWIEA